MRPALTARGAKRPRPCRPGFVLRHQGPSVNGILRIMNDVSQASIRSLGYNAVSARWRALFGRAARKIPLDAGFSCPNRGGEKPEGGCSFCNADGSGPGRPGTLREQWDWWREKRVAKWGDVALVGYLQAFSNTYGPASRLAGVLEELARLPGLDGLCLGTRPDCLDEEKFDLLAAWPVKELWLELGLQSSNPATLARVGRGHDPACFAQAVRQAAQKGLLVAAHLMAGLPGETPEDWLASVDFINALPVAGVKFHNVYVPKGTRLEIQLASGSFSPPTLAQYADFMAQALARLRPDIVVHRLSADPAPNELVAPAWAGDKRLVLDAILDGVKHAGIRQGTAWPGGTAPFLS